MQFRAEQDLAGTITEVEAALIDPEFYASLGNLTKIGAPEVLDTSRDVHEVVQRVRYRFVADLPGAVTVTGEIKVRVALVHTRVERVIVEGLKEFAVEQAHHLDAWLRDRS